MDEVGDKHLVGVSESEEPRVSETTVDNTDLGELFSWPKSDDFRELDLSGCSELEIPVFGNSTSLRG